MTVPISGITKYGRFSLALAACLVTACASLALLCGEGDQGEGAAPKTLVLQADVALAVDTETGTVEPLFGSLKDLYYVYSPDGTRVAFSCDDDGTAYIFATDRNLCLWDATGPVLPPVFQSESLARDAALEDEQSSMLDASWSPDGQRIAFLGYVRELDTADLYVVELSSGDSRRVAEGPPATLWGPLKWSPDGQRIATRFSDRFGGDHLISIDLRTTTLMVLTSRIGRQGYSVEQYSWSPDSELIAFTYNELNPPNPSLYVASVHGSTERIGSAWGGTTPAWSPDGQWIAATQVRDERAHLVIVRSDGTEEREVAPGLTRSDTAAWSPNSSSIAFEGSPSTESGDRRLYVADLNAQSPPREISGEHSLALFPLVVWSTDGKRILFTADAGACRGGCPPGKLFMTEADGSAKPRLLYAQPIQGVLGWK